MSTDELLGNNLIELDQKLTAFKEHHHRKGIEEVRQFLIDEYKRRYSAPRASDGPQTDAHNNGYFEGLEHAYMLIGSKLLGIH